MGEWTLSVNDKDLDADIHPPRHVFTAAAVRAAARALPAIDAMHAWTKLTLELGPRGRRSSFPQSRFGALELWSVYFAVT